MSSNFEKYQKRRLISSYLSVIISISLVLFPLGLLGLLVLNSKKVADYFKEQIAMMKRMPDNYVGLSPWILVDFRSPR